jgi:hypothetical protein
LILKQAHFIKGFQRTKFIRFLLYKRWFIANCCIFLDCLKHMSSDFLDKI